MMRRDHAAAVAPMTVERNVSLDYPEIAPAAVGTKIIDMSLALPSLHRHVVMTSPSWFETPAITQRADLAAVVAKRQQLIDERSTRSSSRSGRAASA